MTQETLMRLLERVDAARTLEELRAVVRDIALALIQIFAEAGPAPSAKDRVGAALKSYAGKHSRAFTRR